MIRRLLPHPALSTLLVLLWLLMENGVTAGGVLTGLLLGIALPLFTRPFWPARPRVRFGGAMIAYVALVLWDIVAANVQVAILMIFRRNRDLRPAWLVVPVELTAPEALSVLAATISLTPGTVTADTSRDRRHLLVHALDIADPAAEVARIRTRYEARLKRIFA